MLSIVFPGVTVDGRNGRRSGGGVNLRVETVDKAENRCDGHNGSDEEGEIEGESGDEARVMKKAGRGGSENEEGWRQRPAVLRGRVSEGQMKESIHWPHPSEQTIRL